MKMNSLLFSTLLELWEDNTSSTPVQRALALVVLNCQKESGEVLAGLPLGQRDSVLIDLREQLFGERLTGIAKCPNCACDFEITFETSSIRANCASNDVFNTEIRSKDGSYYRIELRPINSRDLIESKGDRNLILERCIIAINSKKDKDEIKQFISESADLINECTRALTECDPQADIQLEFYCSECKLTWDAPFDIASYLWREIETWAKRTLREIHLLASTYGWTEQQILELTPRRRRSYLEMVVG
jgi:hypothetical protein